jgi:hypothetical protein
MSDPTKDPAYVYGFDAGQRAGDRGDVVLVNVGPTGERVLCTVDAAGQLTEKITLAEFHRLTAVAAPPPPALVRPPSFEEILRDRPTNRGTSRRGKSPTLLAALVAGCEALGGLPITAPGLHARGTRDSRAVGACGRLVDPPASRKSGRCRCGRMKRNCRC